MIHNHIMTNMKTAVQNLSVKLAMIVSLLVLVTISCENEDDGFPITTDLRVLQVKSGSDPIKSGVSGVTVLPEFQLVFSHPLNSDLFEAALSVTPAVDFTLTYDETKSFVTVTTNTPLQYETAYAVSLPKGAYGVNGESSLADFEFSFTTAAFNPPKLTLTTSASDLYEGDEITITAKISESIFSDVTFNLAFAGTAEGGGVDYAVTATAITIPAGTTTKAITLTALTGDEIEGNETIIVTVADLVNAVEDPTQTLQLILGDSEPLLELKGIMSLKIGGTSTNGRAIHLRARADIADLSEYGIGIANNGGGTDDREIDLPAIAVSVGDDILLVRDIDEAGLTTYFGACYTGFEHVATSTGVNFNGDDAVELYQGTVVIETFGEVTFTTVGPWEYTGSWAYKLGGVWIYGGVDCSASSTETSTSNCEYPFCSAPVQLQGILAFASSAGSLGTNGGKAVHVRVNRDIADFSQFGIGVTNNGGGVSLKEFDFPAIAVKEGDHILFAREPATIAVYFGSCYDKFAYVFQDDNMTQNGDDAVQLFEGNTAIETYGDISVDGTGQPWEYTGSWGYKVGSIWTYGGVDCTAGSTDNATSGCPYVLCEE